MERRAKVLFGLGIPAMFGGALIADLQPYLGAVTFVAGLIMVVVAVWGT